MANRKNSSTTITIDSPLEKAPSSSTAATVSKALPSHYVHEVERFLIRKGISGPLAENTDPWISIPISFAIFLRSAMSTMAASLASSLSYRFSPLCFPFLDYRIFAVDYMRSN
ncbi:uncharacterized protein LOC110641109 [Hevea brasiliensis]|uniref:uncharacterized protein LOC110641109 n=1 Tax=Hevea brasiliensis TaxID=3981 RepID=UPI0025E83793|nr:uncharacterized protein LOC110641109 [Hevea brasiliensis]